MIREELPYYDDDACSGCVTRTCGGSKCMHNIWINHFFFIKCIISRLACHGICTRQVRTLLRAVWAPQGVLLLAPVLRLGQVAAAGCYRWLLAAAGRCANYAPAREAAAFCCCGSIAPDSLVYYYYSN